MLGKFEEIVLLSLLKSGPPSTATDIYEVISNMIDSETKFAASFSTLNRLEKKGLVETKKDYQIGVDGKRRNVRFFSITGVGHTALRESLDKTDTIRLSMPDWGFA